MASSIHPSAIVDSKSILGNHVVIGPYAVVEEGALVGDGSEIESHAIVKKWARVGENVRVGHFSVVGGDPQHLGFDCKIPSFANIDKNSRIGRGLQSIVQFMKIE